MSDVASYRSPKLPAGFGMFRLMWVAAVVALIFVLANCYFIVQPTEMAGVRRLGTVLTKAPLPPGFHFKAPFIDRADTLQVSIDTLRLDKLRV